MNILEENLLEYFGQIDNNFIDALSDPEIVKDYDIVTRSNGQKLPLDKYIEIIKLERDDLAQKAFPDCFYTR